MSSSSASRPGSRPASGLCFDDIRQLFAEQEAGPASQPPTSSGSGGGGGPHSPRPSEPGALSRDSSRVLHSLSSLRGPPLCARGASPAASPSLSRVPSMPPAPERPPALQRYLEKRCRRALQILERAQQPRFSLKKGGYAKPLPPAVVRCCKGLAFVTQRKAGLLAGWDWGSGLVMQRFADGSWSAPCFMRLRYASLGFTLGAQRIQSCHVLQSSQQLLEFVERRAAVALDCALPSPEVDPQELEAPIALIRHRDVGRQAVQMSDGLIYDLSLRGGVSRVDERLHAAVYGAGVTPEQVLAGRAAVPPQFAPLLRALRDVAGEAQVVRHAVSKFQLARQLSASSASHQPRAGSVRGGSPAGGSPVPPVRMPPPAEDFRLFGDVAGVGFVEEEEHSHDG